MMDALTLADAEMSLSDYWDWLDSNTQALDVMFVSGFFVFVAVIIVSVSVPWWSVRKDPLRMPVMIYYFPYHLCGAVIAGILFGILVQMTYYIYGKMTGTIRYSDFYYKQRCLPKPPRQ